MSEWYHHFQTLFEYIDIQKIRTPKGLDWLKAQYPALTQNELMFEMQGIRTMHCTLWTEGVREIISAENSEVKFLVSDHPVTVYNYAAPPESEMWEYRPLRGCRRRRHYHLQRRSSRSLKALIIANEFLERDPEQALSSAGSPSVAHDGNAGFRHVNWAEETMT